MKKKLTAAVLAGLVAFPMLGANVEQASAATSIGVVTLKTNVNLREGKSLSSHVIRVLPKGSKWKVYSRAGGYYSLGGSRYITDSTKYVVSGSVNIPTSTSTPTTSSTTAVKAASTTTTSGSATIDFAKKFMGVPYVWGASSPSGFDCSGFIYYVLKNTGHNVSRLNAAGYWNQFTSTSNPQAGDLVFFKNTYKPGISHVGFYIGNGNFIHASTSKGVTISNVSTSYYKEHFAGYKSVR